MKRSPLGRRTRLRQVSPKRAKQRRERDEVCDITIRRAGQACEARELVPEVKCDDRGWWDLETDEIIQRGVKPGAHLEPDDTQALCHAHHHWKTTNPKLAHRRGLRIWSWEEKDLNGASPRDLAALRQAAWLAGLR